MFIPKKSEKLLQVILRIICLCLPALITFTGCWQPTNVNRDHQAHFDTVFRHADSLLFNERTNYQAVPYLDSVYSHFKGEGIGDLYRKYDFMRNYYYDKDYSRSMLYIDSMLYILKGHSQEKAYRKSYQTTILLKGDILVNQKRLSEAFQYYYEAQQIGEKTKDTAFVSEYLTQLGMICYKQEKYLQAASYFKKATRMYMQVKNDTDFLSFSFIQMNLDNVALAYDRIGMYDSAMAYYNKAMAYINANESRFGKFNDRRYVASAKGVIYGNQAYTLYKMGDTSQVEQLLLKSININKLPGYANDDAMYMQIKLAGLYLRKNQEQDAHKVLADVKHMLDGGIQPDKDLRLRWLLMQQRYFEKIKQSDSAYNYLKLYVALEDSVNSNTRLSHETDISQAFDNVARQYELAALKSDDRFKSFLLVTISLFLCSVIVIASLIWRNSERSKQNLQLVAVQNQRLTTALRSLEARDQENAALLKVIMHDLKNPVGNISAITGLLLDEDYDAEQRREMYQMINGASGQAFAIINQLLENKSKDGLNQLQIAPADLPTLLLECVNLLQFKALNKRQRLKMNRIPPGVANIDRDKIWQLFTNLIDNAIKFSPEKSTISIQTSRTDDTFTIAVKDHGIGIPDELKDKIFTMHNEAGRPGTAGEPSYGLGLSISKKIAELHHGKLWFESKPGEGTTFFVELPCQPLSKRRSNSSEQEMAR